MRLFIQQYKFLLILMGICLFYFIVELFLNYYSMLVVDEFWFAHIVYHYKNGLPYRDFAPYKTVLGYYILLPLMLSTRGILTTLILTKHCLALLNTLIIFFSSLWLIRHFSRLGLISGLIVLVTSDIFLSYTTNIRVDLLGYWFCFFALLCLMGRRFILAGLLIGLGFITTQKTIWYLIASNIALVTQWIFFSRNKKIIGRIINYNIMAGLIIAVYILFWSWISNWQNVINSIFHEASILYHLDWYDSARSIFWSYIIYYNPLLFALWPLTLLSLVVTYDQDEAYQKRFFIVVTAQIILFCLIPYKMIFPYYMQVTIPVLLILYTAFFSWIYPLFQSTRLIRLLVPKPILWLFFLIYIFSIIYFLIKFNLTPAYLLFSFMPLLFIKIIVPHSIFDEKLLSSFQQFTFIIMLFIGILYPITKFSLKTAEFPGDYQQAHIDVINRLLQDGSDYVAGIELIYNKSQHIKGLRQLVGPAIDYLAFPTKKLRSFMLPSLYLDPNVTANSVITSLQNSTVKFYVNTYRIAALPTNIKNYLQSQYEHLWGSIYFYAPLISAGTQHIKLKFTGHYQVESIPEAKIKLANKQYKKDNILFLQKGFYLSIADHNYRLKLLSDMVKPLLNQKFQQEQLKKMVW